MKVHIIVIVSLARPTDSGAIRGGAGPGLLCAMCIRSAICGHLYTRSCRKNHIFTDEILLAHYICILFSVYIIDCQIGRFPFPSGHYRWTVVTTDVGRGDFRKNRIMALKRKYAYRALQTFLFHNNINY